MPGRKQFEGGATPTTLAGGIDASAMSLTLTSANGWPDGSVGPFVAILNRGQTNEEKVLCSSRNENVLTVLHRGWDGSPPNIHGTGASVIHGIDADTIDEANAHVNDPSRDDHEQYLRTDGQRAFTDTLTGDDAGVLPRSNERPESDSADDFPLGFSMMEVEGEEDYPTRRGLLLNFNTDPAKGFHTQLHIGEGEYFEGMERREQLTLGSLENVEYDYVLNGLRLERLGPRVLMLQRYATFDQFYEQPFYDFFTKVLNGTCVVIQASEAPLYANRLDEFDMMFVAPPAWNSLNFGYNITPFAAALPTLAMCRNTAISQLNMGSGSSANQSASHMSITNATFPFWGGIGALSDSIAIYSATGPLQAGPTTPAAGVTVVAGTTPNNWSLVVRPETPTQKLTIQHPFFDPSLYTENGWKLLEQLVEYIVPRQFRQVAGTRVSQPTSLLGEASDGGEVYWEAIEPGNTSVTVEVSIDYGETWSEVAQSGDPIPGIEAGTPLTGKFLLFRQVLHSEYLDRDTGFRSPTLINFGFSLGTRGDGSFKIYGRKWSSDLEAWTSWRSMSNLPMRNSDVRRFAERSEAMGVAIHGDNAYFARPHGFGAVTWIGSVEPVFMEDNDIFELMP